MLCCLPKNAWISGRASEAPGSERIERIVGTGVVDTRMILELRWEKWRKGKSLRRKSAILVKKRSSRDIYGEPMLLRAGDHLMIEDKHRKLSWWMEVRRSEPILVEEPTLRKPDQKIATFPSLTLLRSMWLIRWEKTGRQTESTTFLKLRWIYWRVKVSNEHGWGEASIPNKRGKRPDTKES